MRVAVRTGRCGFEDVNLLEVVGESVDDVAVFVTELDLREHGHTLLLDSHSGRLHAHTHTHTHSERGVGRGVSWRHGTSWGRQASATSRDRQINSGGQ